jgi:hypothetical protein
MQADISSYTDAGAFLAAAPGVATQTFAEVDANEGAGPGGFVITNGTILNNSTNPAMLPGLTIAGGDSFGGQLAYVGAGTAGLPNASVFEDYFSNPLKITFGPGVSAASLDVLSQFNADNMVVTALDPSGNVLGTFDANAPNSGPGNFIGFVTGGGTLIGALDIQTSGFDVAGVDQVQFGNAGAATPEPSFLVLTGLGFAGLVTFAIRRKRKLTA